LIRISNSHIVIASNSEAIQLWRRKLESWIASSLSLLAMTDEYSFAISPRVLREFCHQHPAL
jgi:hypothetical protein